jgi:periplasmic protein CpxP/Spy
MNSKLRLLPLMAGVIALSVSIGSATPAFSQATNPTPPSEAGRHMRRHNFLNLTAEQQAQMEQIHQNTRSQIDAILTEEQRAQLQSERENRTPRTGEFRRMPPDGNGQMLPPPFASLNLTEEQRSQIEAVMRSSREQMDAVLTEEQRQQLEQHRQEHQQRRQESSQAPQAL